MLGKLLKYEIKSTARVFLPLYGGIVIFALLSTMGYSPTGFATVIVGESKTFFNQIPFIVYVALSVAVSVLLIITTIQRFTRNLLGEEGYLMFALPVTASEHILSKLIAAVMWFCSTFLVIGFSTALLGIRNPKRLLELWNAMIYHLQRTSNEFTIEFGANFYLIALWVLVIAVLGAAMYLLMVYASITLGHLLQTYKKLGSIAIFIGLNAIVTRMAIDIPVNMYRAKVHGPMQTGDLFFVLTSATIVCLFLGALYFFATRFVLTRKLNLE